MLSDYCLSKVQNYNQTAKRMIAIVLILLLLITFCQGQISLPPYCPSSSSGQMQSFSITLSTNLFQPYNLPTTQSLLYNFTLPTPFKNQPGIAIGLTSFSSQSSPFLMLSIKPLPLSTLSEISFLLRFFYRYNNWTSITFNFLAQDRTDIEANYYQIDTRELATTKQSKAIQIFLPFSSNFSSFDVLYFINGFEMAIQNVGTSTSPFELQLINQTQSSANANLVISVTTSTQIYSLTISYLYYSTDQALYSANSYKYSSLSSASYLSIPSDLLSNQRFVFGGVNGFIVPSIQGSVQISANFQNYSVQFISNPPLNYFSFQYFTLQNPTSLCFYCQSFPLQYQKTCVSSCPAQTQLSQSHCNDCSIDQQWNGTSCINRCMGGQYWNTITLQCQCPTGFNWDESTCIVCPYGQIWSTLTKSCSCPSNYYSNGQGCLPIPTCPSNQIFNTSSMICSCSLGLYWNGVLCISCPNGLSWNSLTSSCACGNGSYFNGVQCITCIGGMIFDSISYGCVCPSGTAWNGTYCSNICTSPFILTNGQCLCPSGMIPSQDSCVSSPSCPPGMVWTNNQCQNISCSPGSYWNGSICLQYTPSCPINSFWNGQACVSNNVQCPSGSTWNGSYCLPNTTNCPQGTYLSNNLCITFSQQCLPFYTWNGTSCLLVGISATCDSTQYYNGSACIKSTCSGGKIWNTTLVQCTCPTNSYWNGMSCTFCPAGQTNTGSGCNCLTGYFLVDGFCYSIQQIYCNLITNAQWNGQSCVCNPGFDVVGINCVCSGLVTNNKCDKCYNIPNSQMVNGACVCNNGYYISMGQCLPLIAINNSVTFIPNTCNPGTVADQANKLCLPCPDGCLSCLTQAICLQCRLQYTYNWATYFCNEICGDGKRFTLSCDDGNNINGDGCSADCRVQSGYSCYGGSPNSPDYCTQFIPSQIVLNITGTTHLYGKIIVNIKANYLPSNLTNPSLPCTLLCQQILQAQVKGYNSYISITTQYLVGSSAFSFSVVIDFQRQPIGVFTLSVWINQSVAKNYFPTINSGQIYSFNINPAFLALAKTGSDSLV